MAFFQCMSDSCLQADGRGYVFEREIPICPECEAGPPYVGLTVVMHYAFHNKKGKLKGYQGRRIVVACGDYTPVSQIKGQTSYIHAVNCPKCKESEEFKHNWYVNEGDIMSYFDNPNLKEMNIKLGKELYNNNSRPIYPDKKPLNDNIPGN